MTRVFLVDLGSHPVLVSRMHSNKPIKDLTERFNDPKWIEVLIRTARNEHTYVDALDLTRSLACEIAEDMISMESGWYRYYRVIYDEGKDEIQIQKSHIIRLTVPPEVDKGIFVYVKGRGHWYEELRSLARFHRCEKHENCYVTDVFSRISLGVETIHMTEEEATEIVIKKVAQAIVEDPERWVRIEVGCGDGDCEDDEDDGDDEDDEYC